MIVPALPPPSKPPSPESVEAERLALEERKAKMAELKLAIANRKDFSARVDRITEQVKDATERGDYDQSNEE